MAPVKRGPKPDPHRAEALHIAQLTKERDGLKLRLDKALLVIDVQKKTCSLAGQLDGAHRRLAMIAAVAELKPLMGTGAACRALGLPRGVPARQRAQVLRAALAGPKPLRAPRARPPLAFDAVERVLLLDTLNLNPAVHRS